MIEGNGNVYFTDKELACPCCGRNVFADGFLDDLLALRLVYGKPMIITSACRCKDHNEAVGGADASYHLSYDNIGCMAVDIKRPYGADLHRLVKIATSQGWTLGIAKDFIHMDKRMGKTIFTYY